MSAYRVIWVGNERLRAGPSIEFDCADDRAAIKHASDLSDHRTVELWHDERLVAWVSQGGQIRRPIA